MALNSKQPAVIPTSPAITPKLTISTPTFSLLNKVINPALNPPKAPANKVFNNIEVTSALKDNKLPALNPNHAKKSTNTPNTIKLWLLGEKYVIFPFLNLPSLGPKTIVPASPTQAPIEWTTVEPAKNL